MYTHKPQITAGKCSIQIIDMIGKCVMKMCILNQSIGEI